MVGGLLLAPPHAGTVRVMVEVAARSRASRGLRRLAAVCRPHSPAVSGSVRSHELAAPSAIISALSIRAGSAIALDRAVGGRARRDRDDGQSGRRARSSGVMFVQSQQLVTSVSLSFTASSVHPYTWPRGDWSTPPIVHCTSRSGTICATVSRTSYLTNPSMSSSGVRSTAMSNTSPTALSGWVSGGRPRACPFGASGPGRVAGSQAAAGGLRRLQHRDAFSCTRSRRPRTVARSRRRSGRGRRFRDPGGDP